MPSEEQLVVGSIFASIVSGTSWGQKVTISNRTVTSLFFYLVQDPTAGGTLTFLIRAVSGDAILATQAWGNSVDISTTPAWYNVAFDTPATINEEVYLLATSSGGSAGNLINTYATATDVKASEVAVTRTSGGSYAEQTGRDAPYVYVYHNNPQVSTQAVTNVSTTTATGNGTIVSIGGSAVTQHGHVWATTIDPDTTDSKTSLGAATAGAFTSSITGLIVGQQYFTRAYSTNTEGTGYGANVRFTADRPNTILKPGDLAVIQTRLHYVDNDGKERYLEGILI